MNWQLAYWVLGAGLASLIITGMVRRYALRKRLLDVPNARSSHTVPTPRGGGLAIVIAFAGALLLIGFYGLIDFKTVSILLGSGGIVAAIGFLDDRHSLPAVVRFAAHALASCLFVFALGAFPESALMDFGVHDPWIGASLVIVALIWSTNLFNFMDGIDGIAGSEAIFIGGAGAYFILMQQANPGLGLAMVCLCAASGGFLAWNWPRARIFMGDVGSGFLGFTLPMLAFVASWRMTIPLQVWVILFGLFAVDATVTLLRRMARGERWFEAHRLHGYQHLARRWKDHLPVTVLFSAINLLWLLPWAWCAAKFPQHATLCLCLAWSPLIVLALIAGSGRQEHAS